LQQLHEARVHRGLTLKALGEASGVDASTICRYEKGQQIPSVYRAFALADALEVDVAYLVGRTDDPDRTSSA